MQITKLKSIQPTKISVKADVMITFDNCFMISEIRIIKSRAGLFVSMPSRKQSDGTDWDMAYPANTETRITIQRVILAEYEKVVAEGDPKANAK